MDLNEFHLMITGRRTRITIFGAGVVFLLNFSDPAHVAQWL
jgi:hypothetical protein